MAETKRTERLEITVDPAFKRALMRWARRMNVSCGAILEYCFSEQEDKIREHLASIEDDIREAFPNITDGEMSDAAFEQFGKEFVA